MDVQHSPEAPRDSRGASSWARRVNDSTVEWLAAYCRMAAVAWSVAAFCGLLYTVWWPSWSAAVTAALVALWAAAHAGMGFYVLANPEWKDADRGEADE